MKNALKKTLCGIGSCAVVAGGLLYFRAHTEPSPLPVSEPPAAQSAVSEPESNSLTDTAKEDVETLIQDGRTGRKRCRKRSICCSQFIPSGGGFQCRYQHGCGLQFCCIAKPEHIRCCFSATAGQMRRADRSVGSAAVPAAGAL